MQSDASSQLERRRRVVAERWNLGAQAVVIGAGEPVPVPGRGDRTYPFRAHSEYFYLTDRERPGGVLAFDAAEGWDEFLQPVTREQLLWEGVDGLQEGVPGGARARSELAGWLDERCGRRVGSLGSPVDEVTSEPSF